MVGQMAVREGAAGEVVEVAALAASVSGVQIRLSKATLELEK